MKNQTKRGARVRRASKTGRFVRSPAHVSQQRFLQATRVYVMHNIPFFFLNKFGITDHTRNRRRNVSETTPGYVFCLFSPTLEFGWQLEQFIHGLYRLQNVRFWTGSGRTEWFIVLNPVVGTGVWWLSAKYGIDLTWKQHAAAYFLPFVWLDGLFWLAVFYALRVIISAALIIAFLYWVAHIGPV